MPWQGSSGSRNPGTTSPPEGGSPTGLLDLKVVTNLLTVNSPNLVWRTFSPVGLANFNKIPIGKCYDTMCNHTLSVADPDLFFTDPDPGIFSNPDPDSGSRQKNTFFQKQ